jgi:hypothetical protein
LPSSATFDGVGNVVSQAAGPVAKLKVKKKPAAKAHKKKRRKAKGSRKTKQSSGHGKRGARGGK